MKEEKELKDAECYTRSKRGASSRKRERQERGEEGFFW